MVAETEEQLGPIDLLVANAGMAPDEDTAWEMEPADWWRTFEVNVLGVYLCNRAVIPGMLERGRGRIVNVASGAAYLPGSSGTSYSASKAAVHRFSETLANQLEGRIPVFSISPGLVRTSMTDEFGDDAPWTPPSWRRASCARLPQDGSTRSPAATSTPSTTTSTTSHGAQARSSRTT